MQETVGKTKRIRIREVSSFQRFYIQGPRLKFWPPPHVVSDEGEDANVNSTKCTHTDFGYSLWVSVPVGLQRKPQFS